MFDSIRLKSPMILASDLTLSLGHMTRILSASKEVLAWDYHIKHNLMACIGLQAQWIFFDKIVSHEIPLFQYQTVKQ